MRKRVLSFLLAASAAFCFIFSSAPEAHAIVPIGLVQSALASYVASAGYKLWNDNGTGQEILKSLSDLYDGPFLAYAESTLGVNIEVNDLSYYADNDMVYQDNSGQIVVRKAAADMFQQFADWIQTEYSVPVGSDTPTEVVPASGGSDFTLPNGATGIICNVTSSVSGFAVLTYMGRSLGVYSGTPWYAAASYPCTIYFCRTSSTLYYMTKSVSGNTPYIGALCYDGETFSSGGLMTPSPTPGDWISVQLWQLPSITFASDFPVSSVAPVGSDTTDIGGVGSLGVTIAQAVADVVGQAKEDDAVVIGVGASAGATAQDIADMVAQGIKAQTLNPSVSITAEAVIDTPVQPYPDIDGLGLPTLGAALVDRFPFCIPWDFVDTVRLLSADPQPINIKVDLIPQRIKTAVGISSDTSFDIDLSGEQYAKIGVFCRWGSLITFCFGLFLLTKRLVWTA